MKRHRGDTAAQRYEGSKTGLFLAYTDRDLFTDLDRPAGHAEVAMAYTAVRHIVRASSGNYGSEDNGWLPSITNPSSMPVLGGVKVGADYRAEQNFRHFYRGADIRLEVPATDLHPAAVRLQTVGIDPYNGIALHRTDFRAASEAPPASPTERYDLSAGELATACNALARSHGFEPFLAMHIEDCRYFAEQLGLPIGEPPVLQVYGA